MSVKEIWKVHTSVNQCSYFATEKEARDFSNYMNPVKQYAVQYGDKYVLLKESYAVQLNENKSEKEGG